MRDKGYFTVTTDHLMLLRRAYTSWDGTEYGAPSIDPKRPYGNSNVEADIAEIIDGIGQSSRDAMDNAGTLDDFEKKNGPRYRKLHEETRVALEIALRVGYFKAGRYVCDQYRSNWRPAWLEPGALVKLRDRYPGMDVGYRLIEVFSDVNVALIMRHDDPDDTEPFTTRPDNLEWYADPNG